MIFIGKIWDERSAAQIIASTPKLKWSSRVCTAVWGGLTARWKCKSTTDHLALLVLLLYVRVFTSLPPKMLIDWPNKTDKFTKNDILNQQILFFSFSYVVKKKFNFLSGCDLDCCYWRRRHAGGHHCAQQLLRLGPVCWGLPAQQQPADYCWSAHWVVWSHSVIHHVCGEWRRGKKKISC